MLYCSQETPAQRATTEGTAGKSRTAGAGGTAGNRDRLNYGSYAGKDEDCIGDAQRTQGSLRFQMCAIKHPHAQLCTQENTQLYFN